MVGIPFPTHVFRAVPRLHGGGPSKHTTRPKPSPRIRCGGLRTGPMAARPGCGRRRRDEGEGERKEVGDEGAGGKRPLALLPRGAGRGFGAGAVAARRGDLLSAGVCGRRRPAGRRCRRHRRKHGGIRRRPGARFRRRQYQDSRAVRHALLSAQLRERLRGLRDLRGRRSEDAGGIRLHPGCRAADGARGRPRHPGGVGRFDQGRREAGPRAAGRTLPGHRGRNRHRGVRHQRKP